MSGYFDDLPEDSGSLGTSIDVADAGTHIESSLGDLFGDVGLAPVPEKDTLGSGAVKVAENFPPRMKQAAGGIVAAAGAGTGSSFARKLADSGEDGELGMMDKFGLAAEAITAGPAFVREMLFGQSDAEKAVRQKVVDAGMDLYHEASSEVEGNQPNVDSKIVQFALDVERGAMDMVPAIVAGRVAGPGAGAAVIGGQVAGHTYGERKAMGQDDGRALQAAKIHMLAEGVPELIPFHFILKPGETFLRRVFTSALGEGAQESITSVIQQTYDNTDLENMSLKEAMQNIDWGQAAYDGAVGVGVGGSLAAGTHPFVAKETDASEIETDDADLTGKAEETAVNALDPNKTGRAVNLLDPQTSELQPGPSTEIDGGGYGIGKYNRNRPDWQAQVEPDVHINDRPRAPEGSVDFEPVELMSTSPGASDETIRNTPPYNDGVDYFSNDVDLGQDVGPIERPVVSAVESRKPVDHGPTIDYEPVLAPDDYHDPDMARDDFNGELQRLLVEAKKPESRFKKHVDPAVDELQVAMAKAGGINRKEAESQGVDPAYFKESAKVLGHPLFPKQGGKTLDEMAETLVQDGYGSQEYSANEMLQLLSDSLGGRPVHSNQFNPDESYNEVDALAGKFGRTKAANALEKALKGQKLGNAQSEFIDDVLVDIKGRLEQDRQYENDATLEASNPEYNEDARTALANMEEAEGFTPEDIKQAKTLVQLYEEVLDRFGETDELSDIIQSAQPDSVVARQIIEVLNREETEDTEGEAGALEGKETGHRDDQPEASQEVRPESEEGFSLAPPSGQATEPEPSKNAKPATPQDIFGDIPVNEQAIADKKREVNERLSGDYAAPEEGGDLFSGIEKQQEIEDEIKKDQDLDATAFRGPKESHKVKYKGEWFDVAIEYRPKVTEGSKDGGHYVWFDWGNGNGSRILDQAPTFWSVGEIKDVAVEVMDEFERNQSRQEAEKEEREAHKSESEKQAEMDEVRKALGTYEEKPAEVAEDGVLGAHGLDIVKTETKNGNPAWEVSGNTKEHKAALKAAGGRWYGPKKVWTFYGGVDPSGKIVSAINGAEQTEEPKFQPAEESEVKGNPKAAKKLRFAAESLKKKAEESLAQERNTHTHRMADMASRAEAEARHKLYIADTMFKIADALDRGEVEYLSGISAKTHIDLFDKMLSRAKHDRVNKQYDSYAEQKRHYDDPLTVKDANFVEYPYARADGSILLDFANQVEKYRGGKQVAKKLRYMSRIASGESFTFRLPEDIETGKKFLKILKDNGENYLGWQIRDRLADMGRLERMGIMSDEDLKNAAREYIGLTGEKAKSDPIKELERGLVGSKIPGFFPTPKAVVERMVEEAEIESGMSVLEPSAGKGNILDVVKERHPDANLSAIERHSSLYEILSAKGYDAEMSDFMEHTGKQYDRIIMNPPFENGQDIDHVRHAFELLEPGGKVAAIVSEGAFFRGDRKATEFREWLDEREATDEKLESGTFQGNKDVRETGVASRMVVIEKPSDAATTVDEAAKVAALSPENDLPEPTEAQKEAGNYKKAHVTIHGLDIAIENPKGSTRSGTDLDGKAWEVEMQHHYGYIKRTEGGDGEHIDVFVGPDPESEAVYIVNQVAPGTGAFDEHKVVLGAHSEEEAGEIYASNYADDWEGNGGIVPMTIGEFKEWLDTGDTSKPAISEEIKGSFKADYPFYGEIIVVPLNDVRAPSGSKVVATEFVRISQEIPKKERERFNFEPADNHYRVSVIENGEGQLYSYVEYPSGYTHQGNILTLTYSDIDADVLDSIRALSKVNNKAVKMFEDETARRQSDDLFAEPETAKEPETTKKKSQSRAVDGNKIEDFGEKIGGARKDIWSGFKDKIGEDVEDADILAMPLSKLWPEPDYKSMVDGGADIDVITAVKVMRDLIPRKPSARGYKFKRVEYVELVKLMRSAASGVMNGSISVDRFKELATKNGKALGEKVNAMLDLYKATDFPNRKAPTGYTLGKRYFSLYNGEEDVTKWILKNTGKSGGQGGMRNEAAFDSYDDAIEYLKVHLDSEQDSGGKRKTKFDIWSVRGEPGYVVGKKLAARKYIDLKSGFDSFSEAKQYINDNYQHLVDGLAKKKEVKAHRKEANLPREGEDYRKGEDVTPEQFAETFGFRGVEFGNYVEQGRRQLDLNDAYDGLLDLAKIIGIPTKAISLNGSLGLAFGARGKGGKRAASAHYESDSVAINLTKGSGAGSLAHEWWHSLDNYFGKQAKMIPGKHGYLTQRTNISYLPEGARKKLGDVGVRHEVLQAFDDVLKAVRDTDLPARSMNLDATRTKDYWSLNVEMTARAFESYIIKKNQDKGEASDYLANIVPEEAHDAINGVFGIESDDFPYIRANEMEPVEVAYDRLFETLDTEETESGVALFNAKPVDVSPALDHDAVVAITRKISSSLGVSMPIVVHKSESMLPEEILREAIRQGADGKIQGVFFKGDNKIHVVSSNIDDARSLEETILHEALGHYGARELFGKGMHSAYRRLYIKLGGEAGIRKLSDKHGVDMGLYLDHAASLSEAQKMSYLTDEFLAHIQGSRAYEGVAGRIKRAVSEFIGAIRNWLSEHGFLNLSRMNDADLAYVLKRMTEAATGKPGGAGVLNDRREGVEVADVDIDSTILAGLTPEQRKSKPIISMARKAWEARGVESPWFKRWFKDSKIAHSDGAPKVVFHGSPDTDIEAFDLAALGASGHATTGLGIFAANDINLASKYGENGMVYRLYASIQNPYRMSLNEAQNIDTKAEAEALRARLQAQGYDGITFGTEDVVEPYGEPLQYIVAFEPSQYKSVDNRGSFEPTDDAIRFNTKKARSVKPDDIQSVIDEVEGAVRGLTTWDSIKNRAADLVDMDTYRKGILGALNLRQLADVGKDVLPQMRIYVNTAQSMFASRTKYVHESSETAKAWDELYRKDKASTEAMAEIMYDATMAGTDPAEDFVPIDVADIKQRIAIIREQIKSRGGEDTTKKMEQIKSLGAKIKNEGKRKVTHAALKERFETLPRANQEMYVEVRDFYEARFKKMHKALSDRIDRAEISSKHKRLAKERLRQEFEAAQIEGPYFPLSRFGDYWLSVTDKSTGETAFTMYDSPTSWKKAAKAFELKGFEVERGKNIETMQALHGASSDFLVGVADALDEIGGHMSEKAKDAVYQLYLQTMPDASIRKSFIHRKKATGFSKDALRSFAKTSFHGSYQLARLEFTDIMEEQLVNLEESSKKAGNVAKARDIYEELERRHEWIQNPQSGGLANAMTSLGFAWYLGVTPAAALVNTSQTAIVAYPLLAEKFGWKAAGAELASATRDYFKSGASIKEKRMFSVQSELEGDELRAYEFFVDEGLIDKTLTHDLIAQSETSSAVYNSDVQKVNAGIGFLFHHAERFNREATAMAAYRLARKSGMRHDAAVQYASDLTWDSHFDYSNANKARYMQGDTARVILMFRQYSANMTYLLARNFQQVFAGESREVRRAALKRLTGVLGMTSVFAGTTGLPLFWLVEMIMNAVFDDDDEPYDFETEYRNFLADNFGETAGDVITKGPVDKITGAGFSGRVSLNDLWFRDPGREMDETETVQYWMAQVLGPIGGILTSHARGLELIHEGHLWRGTEMMIPKFAKDAMKGARYADEGVQSLKGDPIVDDVSAWQYGLQAIGFTPGDLANQYDANRALKNIEQRILGRRKLLVNRWWLAYRNGDQSGVEAADAAIDRFNQKNPSIAITGKTKRKSAMGRGKSSARTQDGVILNKRLEHLREDVRF